MPNVLQQLNHEMTGVIDRVQPSLVAISNGHRHGTGAGTIWHPDGLIITNAHVVHNPEQLRVTLPGGRSVPAVLIAMDEQIDIAALEVDASDLPAIELGDSRALKSGEWVFAIGHPWGVAGAVTAGVVIDMGNALPEQPTPHDWIAVNLRLRPGNSGGPLVDAAGRLLGLNTIMNGPTAGLAVPVHVIEAFLEAAVVAADATHHAQPTSTPPIMDDRHEYI